MGIHDTFDIRETLKELERRTGRVMKTFVYTGKGGTKRIIGGKKIKD